MLQAGDGSQDPMSRTTRKSELAVDVGMTSSRKQEHIRICLDHDVEFSGSNGFEQYRFVHRALPEVALNAIDTSTEFLGKRFEWPFLIEAMTGGAQGTDGINRNLARAAQELGIGMGVGSQRAMLEEPRLAYTYQVRDVAPDIFLLGNIGAAQIVSHSIDQIGSLVRGIGADGLAVHLNPAQEISQSEGDTDWSHVPNAIEMLCKGVDFPVVAKEIGFGISRDVARALEQAGVACIDVSGAGGTSWIRVEHYRGAKISSDFFEWGLQTAESLRQCREAVAIPLIASGGIRTGLECAKALALGASLVGFALPLLRPALESHQAVVERIQDFNRQLRMAMFLVGARNLEELKRARILSEKPVVLP